MAATNDDYGSHCLKWALEYAARRIAGLDDGPSLEERIQAFTDRAEARFQDDWTMAIGMDVLRDRELKAKP